MRCRINRRRIWSNRIVLESMNHSHNSFLTVTYDKDALPNEEFYSEKTGQIYASHSVNPDVHRQFIDLLRTRFRRATGNRIRFYGVGEYGEKKGRPHYHYALFGYPSCLGPGPRIFPGKFIPCTCDWCRLAADVWQKGNVFLGTLTLDSAQYVAGYVTKKMTGDSTEFQQNYLQGRYPEFSRMSNKPGIARWAADYVGNSLIDTIPNPIHSDVPAALVHNGKLMPIGRYMSDKVYSKLGITFEDGERLQAYKKSMQTMLNAAEIHGQIPGGIHPSAAFEILNKQSTLNLESKSKLFTKEKAL